jgi:hypothetical protein
VGHFQAVVYGARTDGRAKHLNAREFSRRHDIRERRGSLPSSPPLLPDSVARFDASEFVHYRITARAAPVRASCEEICVQSRRLRTKAPVLSL